MSRRLPVAMSRSGPGSCRLCSDRYPASARSSPIWLSRSLWRAAAISAAACLARASIGSSHCASVWLAVSAVAMMSPSAETTFCGL